MKAALKQGLFEKEPFNEIRGMVISQGEKYPESAFHVISNLVYFRYENQVERLVDSLPEGKVLEIGCGMGQTAAMLAVLRPDIELIGLDLNPHRVWNSLAKFGVQFTTGNALGLPYQSGEFDAVVSFGVMEHTGEDLIFLKEIRRVLKTGGSLFIFNLPNRSSFSELLAAVIGLEHHKRKYTRAQVEKLLSSTGFAVEYLKREHLLPAQPHRVNQKIGEIFNRHYITLYKIDSWLMKSPLCYLAQGWAFRAKKLRAD